MPPETLMGVTLPEFYTQPIPVPPEITPIRSVTASSDTATASSETLPTSPVPTKVKKAKKVKKATQERPSLKLK